MKRDRRDGDMPRGRTENLKRARRGELRDRQGLPRHPDAPRVRSECVEGPRPCPWVGCRYHLALNVMRNGNLTIVFPDVELEEMIDTCALDVADRGPHTLDEVGQLTNLTRERIRQLEVSTLAAFCRRLVAVVGHRGEEALRELLDAALVRGRGNE